MLFADSAFQAGSEAVCRAGRILNFESVQQEDKKKGVPMSIKSLMHVFPAEVREMRRNEYSDSLANMFVEAARVDPNFCTYQRWESTDYTGPFSELKSGFLVYIN
ncbi:MAG: hypothetical protein O7A69_03550 [SAR324 cluster bacterium]|nr:hypothetical protein [SAR324 cluster bacterium]